MRIGFDGSSLESPAGGVRRYATELLSALVRVNTSDELVVFGAPAVTALPAVVHRRPVTHVIPTNLGRSLVDLPRAVRRERLGIFQAPSSTAPLPGLLPLLPQNHAAGHERQPRGSPSSR